MTLTIVAILLIFVVVASTLVVYTLKTKISILEIRLHRRKRSEKIPSLEGSAPALTNRTLPENPMADFLP